LAFIVRQESPGPLHRVLALLDVLLSRASLMVEGDHAGGGRVRLVTMKPMRGYNSPGCHSTLATTRRFRLHDPA
jgi:hypothetical protein